MNKIKVYKYIQRFLLAASIIGASLIVIDFVKDESLKVNTDIRMDVVELNKTSNDRMVYVAEDNPVATFDNENLLRKSNITADGLKSVLAEKSNGSMEHLAETIVKAEREYGVNAFFLSGVIALESGWGRSRRAKEQNNLTGMGVYNDSSAGKIYENQNDSVMDLARQLKTFYLTDGAVYYNGPSSSDVEEKYCEKKDWNEKIDNIAMDLLSIYKNEVG